LTNLLIITFKNKLNLMLSILINAYAVAPNKGSEPGMGWNWIVNLSHYCELHIITEGEWQQEIEVAVALLPQKKNLHFYYNSLPETVRSMCWNQGDWRFYYYYQKWQKSTLEIARNIVEKKHIDVLHQLNMIGFREPGYLWKLEGIPFIWGPTDAKEGFPVAYLDGAGLKIRLSVRVKNLITRLQLQYGNQVKNAIERSSFIVSASTDSVKTFKMYYNLNTVLINETGCYVKDENFIKPKKAKETFDILWVGKFDFRKQLDLALKVIAKVADLPIRFHIAGGNSIEAQRYKIIAEDLGINSLCIWHGIVPHQDIQDLMQNSDLFFFTSVAEGTPHVVLEAIGNGLPVLCFDCCGQGDSVTNDIGVKIKLSNINKSIADFATKINYLHSNKQHLQQLSANCIAKQIELSWDAKAKKMVSLYDSLMK